MYGNVTLGPDEVLDIDEFQIFYVDCCRMPTSTSGYDLANDECCTELGSMHTSNTTLGRGLHSMKTVYTRWRGHTPLPRAL